MFMPADSPAHCGSVASAFWPGECAMMFYAVSSMLAGLLRPAVVVTTLERAMGVAQELLRDGCSHVAITVERV